MRGRCKSRQIGGARESRLPWRRRRRPPGDTPVHAVPDLSDGLFDSIVPLRVRFAFLLFLSLLLYTTPTPTAAALCKEDWSSGRPAGLLVDRETELDCVRPARQRKG